MATNMTNSDIDQPIDDKNQSNSSGEAPEVESLRDRLMRALAETENTRRLGERRVEEAQQYAITNLARELLQVIDNLRRALDAGATEERQGEERQGDGLLEGVAATDRVLSQILSRYGVEELDPLNKPFDPMKHEAVMEAEESDQPPGNVVGVLENGYMLHDRLLRPARVVVAKPQRTST
jgi:molecular chaperone GrpE